MRSRELALEASPGALHPSRRRAAGAFAVMLLAAALLSTIASRAGSAPVAGVPALERVIVVVMENRSADQALDPLTCPFTAKFARTWTHFPESYAVTHPSQPNYLALWAGSTMKVSNNACPPRGSPYSAVGRRGLVVLTWDEDDHSGDNRILTVFAGPLVRPGNASSRRITHYTLLRTLCDGLRIAPFGEAAADSAITDVWWNPGTGPVPVAGPRSPLIAS